MSSRDFFLGKRVAVIGLGSHGQMAIDVAFLVKANALVSVYDMTTEERLGACVSSLRALGLANCVMGTVPAEDLADMDLIILSHEYPRTSSFLAEAKKKGIQIEYPETLFLKLAPPVTVVGIMGAHGKATILSMLAPMLVAACRVEGIQSAYTIDPESEEGTLAHLRTIKTGDIVAMRITDHMMGEISALNWSPYVALFTTPPEKGAYTDNPYEILKYQTYNNYVIGSDHVIDSVRTLSPSSRAKMLRTKPTLVPDDWVIKGRAPYDRENAAVALQAAKLLKVSDTVARDVLSKWKPLRARLEPVKKVKNIEFWNDAASITSSATIAAMGAISSNRNLLAIIGGSGPIPEQKSDYRDLCVAAMRYAHTLILLPGSGTLSHRQIFRDMDEIAVLSVPSIEEAVRSALDHAQKGDKVLFSPAFGAGGMDRSRLDRGERFVRAVRAL